jgi:tRNA threonylcarbamoyladenosine dehydratase
MQALVQSSYTIACSVDAERRFGGISRLYGAEAACLIRYSHVVVVGVGGVGSWAAEALARSGVGTLTLIDLAESNINRQVHALDGTLGMAKVLAMKARIEQINLQCVVNTVEEFVERGNAEGLIPASAAAIIDACDQTQAKVALAALARTRGVPCFISGAAGGKRFAHHVQVADLAEVTHDPLLASVRQRLRKDHAFASGKMMGVQAVFSKEPIVRDQVQDAQAGLACAGYGSSVAVTATFGMALASLALESIAVQASQPQR